MRTLLDVDRGVKSAHLKRSRQDFLAWALTHVRPPITPPRPTRRSTLIAMLLSPFAGRLAAKGTTLSGGGGYTAIHRNRLVEIANAYGRWNINLQMLSPDALFTIRNNDSKIELSLIRGRILGTEINLDFNCTIDKATDVIEFIFLNQHLHASGSFNEWVQGGELVFEGKNDVSFSSVRQNMELHAISPFKLDSQWRFTAASGQIALSDQSRQLVVERLKIQFPLYESVSAQEVLAYANCKNQVESGEFDLNIGPVARISISQSGQPIKLSIGVKDTAAQCEFLAGSSTLEIGSHNTEFSDSLELKLTNSLLQLRYGLEKSDDLSRLTAFVADSNGSIHSKGVTTKVVGREESPIIRLAANRFGLNELELGLNTLSDYVACDGLICDSGIEPRPVQINLNTTENIKNVRGFLVHPRSGDIQRKGLPLALHLRRREGRIDLRVELHNIEFAFDLGGVFPPQLKKIDTTKAAIVLFVTPPQHVGEMSMVVDSSNQNTVPTIDSSSLNAQASFPSRIALQIPTELFPYRFSIENMLQWQYFEPITKDEFSEEYRNPLSKPLERIATVINLFKMSLVPVRLDRSANFRLRWLPRATNATKGAANEIWHARLIDEDLRPDPAISSGVGIGVAQVDDWKWPPTEIDCAPPQKLIWPISLRDRIDLRVLTFLRKFALREGSPVIDRETLPLLGNTVVISSQGGYFNLQGSWEVDQLGISLVKYLHKIAQGRDIGVTIIREYFMYPFGHRMLLVKQTSRNNRYVIRKVDSKETKTGQLETRFFLIAKDEELAYPAWVQPMPFRSVRIAHQCLRSPLLDFDVNSSTSTNDEYKPPNPIPRTASTVDVDWKHQAFWVTVGGNDYAYEFEAIDYAGNSRQFKRSVIMIENKPDDGNCASTLAFLKSAPSAPWSNSASWLEKRFNDSRQSFNGIAKSPKNISEINSINIAVAEPIQPGDTDLELLRLCFTAKWKPKKINISALPISADIHTCPWVPSVHWTEGRFTKGVLPGATYDNSGADSIVRWLIADVRTGIIHHPEENGKVWILNQSQEGGLSFPLTSSDDTNPNAQLQAKAFLKSGLVAIIDRRVGAPMTEVRTSYAADTSKAGGLISPDIKIGLASRSFGATSLPRISNTPIVKVAQTSSELIGDFFPVSSKLCGVELQKIIAPLLGESGGSPPTFKDILDGVDDGPDFLESKLAWSISALKKEIKAFPDNGDENAFFYPGIYVDTIAPKLLTCELELNAFTRVSLLGFTQPKVNLSASIKDFTVHIGWGSGSSFNGVRIPVKRMSYVSRNGEKPVFGLDLGKIVFVGEALKFIDQIKEKLEKLGQSDSGWRIGFENNGIVIDAPPLKFPNVEIGAFAVENLGIYSGLYVPFFNGGGITFWFSLARTDLRFRVTAGIYAGGGYALIELDADHVRRFELCIEFGAAKSLSYGPVKGDVGVLGGLIYKSLADPAYESPGLPLTLQTKVEIEAFVRAFGTFSAWNLISLFMELYVSMTSNSNSGVTGTARFTISTKIGFVSYSYTASHQEQLQKRTNERLISTAGHPHSRLTLPKGISVPQSVIHVDKESDEVDISELLDYLAAYKV